MVMSRRYFCWIVLLSLSVTRICGQTDRQTWEDRERYQGRVRSTEEDSLVVAPEAMQQILRLFEQRPASMEDDPLTVEQLHEWVGEPDEVPPQDTAAQHCRYDSMYFALKLYERELGTVFDRKSISIPGLNDISYRSYVPRPTASFDANHLLSMMFSKKYRTIQRLRGIKEAHRYLYGELY